MQKPESMRMWFFSGFGEDSVYFWASPSKETQPLSFAYVRSPGMVFRVFEKMGEVQMVCTRPWFQI